MRAYEAEHENNEEPAGEEAAEGEEAPEGEEAEGEEAEAEEEDDRDPLEKKLEEVYGVTPYGDRDRGMGTGERRIGNPMEFREDMYSLLFISMVKPVYKKFCEEHQEQDFGERLVNAVNALEEEKENEEDSGEGE